MSPHLRLFAVFGVAQGAIVVAEPGCGARDGVGFDSPTMTTGSNTGGTGGTMATGSNAGGSGGTTNTGGNNGGTGAISDNNTGGAAIDTCSSNCDWYDCDGGTCLPTAIADLPISYSLGSSGPRSIALDESYVYWLGNNVGRVPKTGGEAAGLQTANVHGIYGGIAVDANNVYWTDHWILSETLNRYSLGSQASTVLKSGGSLTSAIAVDATSVYYVVDVANNSDAPIRINSVPITGGAETSLASIDNASGKEPVDFALDDVNLYWVDAIGDLGSVPKNGGVATILAPGFALPPNTELADWSAGIAVDSEYVYWTTCPVGTTNATLRKIPKLGGPITTLAEGSGCYCGLAIDSRLAYWVDYRNGTLSAAPLVGGTVMILADGLSSPVGPAVDNDSVYWGMTLMEPYTDSMGHTLQRAVKGQILKLAKCSCNTASH